MTGNNFLKYPPHKNVGTVPAAEYNLIRLQMEAANIPYMKRVLNNGVLEVRKIFGNEYKALWTPTGGVELTYLIRYKDADSNERIKFLYDDYSEKGDFSRDVLPSFTYGIGSSVPAGLPVTMLLDSVQWKIGDLIAVC